MVETARFSKPEWPRQLTLIPEHTYFSPSTWICINGVVWKPLVADKAAVVGRFISKNATLATKQRVDGLYCRVRRYWFCLTKIHWTVQSIRILNISTGSSAMGTQSYRIHQLKNLRLVVQLDKIFHQLVFIPFFITNVGRGFIHQNTSRIVFSLDFVHQLQGPYTEFSQHSLALIPCSSICHQAFKVLLHEAW